MFWREQKRGFGEVAFATITEGDFGVGFSCCVDGRKYRLTLLMTAESRQACINPRERAILPTTFLFPFVASCCFASFSFFSLTFAMNNCLLLVIGWVLQALNAFVAVNHFLFVSLMSLLCKNRISSVWHPKIG